MPDNLRVSLVQQELVWHQPDQNFDRVQALINSIEETDLILLPEMWSSGYTMQAHKFAKRSAEALELMKEWSRSKKALISGSLIVKEGESYYNRLYVVDKGAVIHTYDKRHLFAYAGEDRIYKAGDKQLVFEYKGWRICGNICYDLRFPVWSRNTMDYDLLFYVANWPNPRLQAWDTLLRARSIENMSYVVGVNCFGKDVWDNEYSGHSACYDALGQALNTPLQKEAVVTHTIEREHITQTRAKFPFLIDRDQFTFT